MLTAKIALVFFQVIFSGASIPQGGSVWGNPDTGNTTACTTFTPTVREPEVSDMFMHLLDADTQSGDACDGFSFDVPSNDITSSDWNDPNLQGIT